MTHFPTDSNNFLLTAHCIVEDKRGFFWITTNKGLFQTSKQNLLEYEAGKIKNVYYHFYNKNNGFNTNEFNGGCKPCGLALENGEISFPSIDGIVFFDPNTVFPLFSTREIYFGDAKVDGKLTQITNNTLELDYNFERLTISVNSPYFGNPENLNIEIRLDGPQSQNWIAVQEKSVSFSSLPPGDYLLTARKLNSFDSNFQYSKIKISIPPPFWKTLWFNALLLTVGIAMVFYITRTRIRYIRKKNKLLKIQIAERTSQLRKTIKSLKKTEQRLSLEIINHKKLIGQITHDIKSPLRYLALTGKHVYQNIDKSEDLTEEIKSIYTSSIQIYNFVENLLEYAKTYEKETISEFNLSELIDEKIILFENIANSQKTEISNFTNQTKVVVANKLLLSIIIHNLLDNAVKNTINGKIIFRSGKIDGRIFVTLQDTGKGMSQEKVDFYNKLTKIEADENLEKRGMGLKIIRELLLIIRGEMHIKSSKVSGTEITLYLPLPKKE